MLRALDPDEVATTAMETGQTASAVRMSLSRANAYDAHETANRLAKQAEATYGYHSEEARTARAASQAAWDEYRSWQDAYTRAAIAGALD